MSAAEQEAFSSEDPLYAEFNEEHEEHADERWLMSYADMMTLLFGLFVMLYAMYDNFGIIQQSAGMYFSSSQEIGGTQEDPAVVKQIEDNAIEKVKIENETLRVKVEAMETALTAEKAKVAEANAMMEVIKVKADTVIPDQSATVRSLEDERDELRAQLARAKAENMQLSNRNMDNRPKEDEPRVELRADGLGGRGNGQGKGQKPGPRHEYQVSITMPDGRIVNKTTKALGPNGLQLDEALDTRGGRKVTVRITSDGKSVEALARTMEADDGSTSTRLRFLTFPNGDQGVVQEWLNRPPPPGP